MLTGSHFKRATFVSGRSPKTIAVVASSVLGYPILAADGGGGWPHPAVVIGASSVMGSRRGHGGRGPIRQPDRPVDQPQRAY